MILVGTVIPALISTAALVLMGVALWLWRSSRSTPELPPQMREEPETEKFVASGPRGSQAQTGGAALPPAQAPSHTGAYAPVRVQGQQGQRSVAPAPQQRSGTGRLMTVGRPQSQRPSVQTAAKSPKVAVYPTLERAGTPSYEPPEVRPAQSGTAVYVPTEPSKTMVFEAPQAAQSNTMLYAPPEPPAEPTNTAVLAAPEPEPKTQLMDIDVSSLQPAEPELKTQLIDLDARSQEPKTKLLDLDLDALSRGRATEQEPKTQLLDLDAASLGSTRGQAPEPTRVVALREFDDSPTRIISLHALFADKTAPIPRAEILALARAAQEAAEAARTPGEAPKSAKRKLETSAGSLPPRGWSTNVAESESEPQEVMPEPASSPEVRREPSVAKAKAPELSESVLREHFEGAVEALRQMDPSDDGRELGTLSERAQARWRSNFEVLKLNGELAARLVLLPSLFDAEQSELHRLTAALALLSMKGGSGLLDAIENFDSVCHRVVTTALAYLDDGVSASSIAAMGSAVTDGEDRVAWLGVFARRGVDPGAELVHELLASKERGALAMGLRLLPLHAEARPLATQIDRHMLSNKAEVRSAALIAGLSLGRPSAWMQCKQAARAPDSLEPCVLVAALGTDKDRGRLVSWAKRAAAPDYVGWALGACGHPTGIAGCLELAERKDEAFVELALAGFVISTGAEVETLDKAKQWWDAHKGEFEQGRRYLRGQPLDGVSLAAELQPGSLRWREALALELLVRSQGEVRIPSAFLISRVAALSEKLETLDMDFETSYQQLKRKASK